MSATFYVTIDANGSKQQVPLINEEPGRGIVVLFHAFGPFVAVKARTFSDAWDAGVEYGADHDIIHECDGPSPECRGENGPCDTCEYVDGFGVAVTLDLTARLIGSVE